MTSREGGNATGLLGATLAHCNAILETIVASLVMDTGLRRHDATGRHPGLRAGIHCNEMPGSGDAVGLSGWRSLDRLNFHAS
jgi:hypothetical protein